MEKTKINTNIATNKKMYQLMYRTILAISSMILVLPISCILAKMLSAEGYKIFKIGIIILSVYSCIKIGVVICNAKDELKIIKNFMLFISAFVFFRAIYLADRLQYYKYGFAKIYEIDFSNIALEILLLVLIQFVVWMLCIYSKKWYYPFVILLMILIYFFCKLEIVKDISILHLEIYTICSALMAWYAKDEMAKINKDDKDYKENKEICLRTKYLCILLIYIVASQVIFQ